MAANVIFLIYLISLNSLLNSNIESVKYDTILIKKDAGEIEILVNSSSEIMQNAGCKSRIPHDLGIGWVYGIFGCPQDSVEISGGITNYGDSTEINFLVTATILDSVGTEVYHDSFVVDDSIPPGAGLIFPFPKLWIPIEIGDYAIKYKHQLANDGNPDNDSALVDAHVINLPGELYYDDGEPDFGIAQESGEGYGARFISPVYPIKIDSIKFYFFYVDSDSAPAMYILAIGSTELPNPEPDSTIFTSEIVYVKSGWNTYNLTAHNIVISEGAIFVAYIAVIDYSIFMAMDATLPWCYNNFYFPWGYLYGQELDNMVRIFVGSATGINEDWCFKFVKRSSNWIISPNPFKTLTKITIQTNEEALLTIYDVTGRKVKDFRIPQYGFRHTFYWDGDDNTGNALPSGVYLVKLTYGGKKEMKKVLKLK